MTQKFAIHVVNKFILYVVGIVNPTVTDTQPVAVGLVVGIVGGVFVVLILIAIFGTCCYKHTQKLKRRHPGYYDHENQKTKLEEREPSHVSVGCTNSSGSMNGLTYPKHESSPRAKTKLLHQNDYSVSNNSRPKTLNLKGEDKKPLPPPNIENFAGSPKKSVNAFDFDDDDPYDKLDDDKKKPKAPKSPFLDALHKNPKFKATFDTTETEAEERRRKISSSSMSQGVNASDASLDSAATPPKLPAVPTVPKSPGSKQKHASIRGRVPRPVSSSEEELQGQRAKTSDESEGERRPSRTEEGQDSKQNKPDTRHTLRPERGKKDKGKSSKDKKLSELPDAITRIGNFEKNPSIRSSKGSRKSNKSPRLGAKNASRGFGHRRNRGDETDGSRPGTPTSVMDREDLESLPRK